MNNIRWPQASARDLIGKTFIETIKALACVIENSAWSQ